MKVCNKQISLFIKSTLLRVRFFNEKIKKKYDKGYIKDGSDKKSLSTRI